MDNEQFAITFLDSDISGYIENLFKLYSDTILIDKNSDKITIVLKIPENAKDCYNKFINGKYSKIDDGDKKEIIKFAKTFLNSHGKDSALLIDSIIQVLYKDKRRADFLKLKMGLKDDEWNDEWEVSSIIDKDSENYILK
jgi:type II secretory pathway component GspD/PulD (secretin)